MTVKTVHLIELPEGQAVPLPAEFRFPLQTVTIRREGAALVVEPEKEHDWPPGFFASIAIDDERFQRPEQGSLPPAPQLP